MSSPVGKILVKRVYESAAESDGFRVLVDRLWPRGVSKAEAKLDLWLRDISPSTALRTWFNHEPARWEEFQRRYRAELKAKGGAAFRDYRTGKGQPGHAALFGQR